jgi:voltage-gated sodium channel
MSRREQVKRLVDAAPFQRAVIAVIVLNAIVLGLMTSERTDAGFLKVVDHSLVGLFGLELALRLYAHGWKFFRDPWNVFDFLVVAVALVPATGVLSVLRALRIIRALRLVTAVPSVRKVVHGLLAAMPGMLSIVLLLCLVLYVGAVVATGLYGHSTPQHFGDIGRSLFTLFQVMTGEAWPDVAHDVLQQHPSAWIFFVLYILASSFVVLNLFTAVVVSAMDHDRPAEENVVLAEVRALREEIALLRQQTGAPGRVARSGAPARRKG